MTRSDIRILLAEIGLTLVLLCGVEGGFRWLVEHGNVRLSPALFRSALTSAKYLAFRQLGRDADPFQVLIMGTSQMALVDAGRLAEILTRKGCPGVAFNFAGPDQSVAFNSLLLERLLLDVRRPRVLLYGVIPNNLMVEPMRIEAEAQVLDLPGFQLEGTGRAARLQGFLIDHVWLFRYREAVLQWAAGDLSRFGQWERAAREVDAYGDLPVGFLKGAFPTTLNANETDGQKMLQRINHDLARGSLFDNIQILAEFCQARDIQLVLLSNPVAPIFLRQLPHGADDYEAFLKRLRATAAAVHVPLLFPVANGIGDPRYFADTVHNNGAGTMWLTDTIADLLTQPSGVDGRAILQCGGPPQSSVVTPATRIHPN